MDTCVREMTLGEEIISLTGKGVDIPTVERMYRKYIAITSRYKEGNRRILSY
jgi:hypothetical protein